MSDRHTEGCTGTLHSFFGHIHTPAALFPRKAKILHSELEAGWDPELVWTLWKIEKPLVPAGNSTIIAQSTIGWLLDNRKICHALHRPPHLQKSPAQSGAVIITFAENIEFCEDILQKHFAPSDTLNNCQENYVLALELLTDRHI